MTVYKTLADVDKAIAAIVRDAGRLQDKIHNVGASLLLMLSRDTDAETIRERSIVVAERMTALQNASPYHAASFAKWVQAFTSFTWAPKTNTWYVDVNTETADLLVTGKEALLAKATPFWKVSPPKAPNPLDIFDEVEKLVAKADKRAKDMQEGDVIDLELVRRIRVAVAERKAELAA